MEKFEIIKALGKGSFGCVWQAMNKETGEVVAIKKLMRNCCSIEQILNMGEVKSLRRLNHPNIIKLKELFTMKNDYLCFVFEYMEFDLLKVMMEKKNGGFLESEVRTLLFQLFQGLAYMHHHGYFHRDLKPENLLLSKDVIKIADLGCAREIYSKPPYTDYVTTRFYRAPEVLLKSPLYNWAVDMWAMGAIMAELFTLCPLFQGSNAMDQMYKICSVMGTPTSSDWPGGLVQANSMHYQFPKLPGVHLSQLIPSASEDAIDLIYLLCLWDPIKRPTASQCLQHPFFNSCYFIPRSPPVTVASSRTYPWPTREKSYRSALMESEFQKLKVGNKSETGYKKDVCPVGKIWMNSGMTKLIQKPARIYAPAAPTSSHASLTTDLQRRLEMNIVDALKNEYSHASLTMDLQRRLEMNIVDSLKNEYSHASLTTDLQSRLEMNIVDALKNEYSHASLTTDLQRRLEMNIVDALKNEYSHASLKTDLQRRLEMNIVDALKNEYSLF